MKRLSYIEDARCLKVNYDTICFEPCGLIKVEEDLNCSRLHNFIVTFVSSMLILCILYYLSRILQQKCNHICFGNVPDKNLTSAINSESSHALPLDSS